MGEPLSDQTVLPLVSVIMPVRNEAHFIRHSLGAVLAQDYPADRVEILVVDGDSDDATVAAVRACAGADPRVHILSNPDRLQAHALNIALAQAQGTIIVRVDGHTIVAPDYVWQCVAALQQTGASAVGGPLRSVGVTPMGRAIAVAYRSPFGVPSTSTRCTWARGHARSLTRLATSIRRSCPTRTTS
jgi:glycosyltransferase involved in cell wall biosynthesis